jgi:hypothetical protein
MQDRKTLSAPVELSDAVLDLIVGGCGAPPCTVSALIQGNNTPNYNANSPITPAAGKGLLPKENGAYVGPAPCLPPNLP